MLPAKESMYKCPHCGGEKALMNLLSGNTFGAQMWSDAKHVAPMLPQKSPIQRCPHCGGYYFLHDAKERPGVDYSFECGWLTFDEACEAMQSLTPQSYEEQVNLFVTFLWSYNDMLREGQTPSQEQSQCFTDFMKATREFWEGDALGALLKAEIHRELGEFDACIQAIEQTSFENEGEKDAAQKILEQAKEKNSAVFPIWKD